MKLDISKGTIIVILFTIIVLILFTRITRSSYTAGTPANDASVISQPVFDSSGKNYQDIDPTVAPWSTPANYVLDTTNPSTWSQANFNCWAVPNCVGIRHNFDTHQTWQLMQPIGTTRNAAVSVNTPTVQFNGQNYSLPLSIVANKSTQDPNPPVNCTWTSSTSACSTSACNTPGTQTTTWSKSVTESHGGVCPAAPASSTVACNTNHPCQTITKAFTDVGTTGWIVPAGVTSVWVLVVGGGGAGGEAGYNNPGAWHAGGGGGGGGVIENRQYGVSPGSYIPITVGAGGSGDGSFTSPKGGDSVFGTLTATGGGRGGGTVLSYPWMGDLLRGGSGGGGDAYYTPPVTIVPGGQGVGGQGYAGGTGGVYAASGQSMSNPYNFYCCGGGGGGAGGPGGNSSGTLAYPSVGKGGDGGPGVTSSIWGQTITVGAGGGGGAGSTPNYQGCLAKNGMCVITPGAGGSNVGGRGGGPTQMNGTNAGGWGCGGGGGSGVAQAAVGGTGSQGIVIIQYQG